MAKRAAAKSRTKSPAKKTARKKSALRESAGSGVTREASSASVAGLFQAYWDRVILGGSGDPRILCCMRLREISWDPGQIGEDFAGVLSDHFPGSTPGQFNALRNFAPRPLELFRTTLGLFLRCPFGGDGHGPIRDPRPIPDPVPWQVKFDARSHDGPDTLVVSVPATGPAEVTFLKGLGRR